MVRLEVENETSGLLRSGISGSSDMEAVVF